MEGMALFRALYSVSGILAPFESKISRRGAPQSLPEYDDSIRGKN